MSVSLRTAVLGGRKIAYRVRASRRAKRLQIRADLHEGLEVVVPSRLYRRTDARAFLIQHAAWVSERLDEMAEKRKRLPRNRFVDGGSFMLFGRACPLRVVSDRTLARTEARYVRGKVVVAGPRSDRDSVRAAVEVLIRGIAREVATARADTWCRELSVKRGRITIRSQKTRWGSCSQTGDLSFNWRLVIAAPELFDYVVAHECVHLVHFDHGPGFRRRLSRLVPRWEQHEAWLAEHGELLVL